MKNIPLTKKERIAIIAGIALLIIGFFSYLTFAGGTIGSSIQLGGFLGGPNINSGLVAHWTFDGANMLQNVVDSGGSNNGFFTGFTSTTTVQGKIGQALNFNSGNYVQVPSSASLNFGTSPFSIAAWVFEKPGPSTLQTIAYKGDEGQNVEYVLEYSQSTHVVRARIVGAPSGNNCTISGTTNIAGAWHHVVAVYNRNPSCTTSDLLIYIDGVQDTTSVTNATLNTDASISNGSNFRIGSQHSGGDVSFFVGAIDDERIYNRALSLADIKRLYSLGAGAFTNTSVQAVGALPGAPNPNSGLVGYWTFDGNNTKQNVTDSGGSGNSGYLSGFTSTTTVQGKIGQALQFDGVAAYVDIPTNQASYNLNPLTASAWVKTTSSANYPSIINKSTGSFNGWKLFMGGGHFCASYTSGGGHIGNGADCLSAGGIQTSGIYNDGKWHHVVFTLDSNGGNIYVDGVFSISQGWAGSQGASVSSQVLDIGKNPAPYLFNGTIDDVRIYNRAFSLAEIQALYAQGGGAAIDTSVQTNSNTGNSLSTGLVGYYTFDGPKMYSNVVDSSGKGNTGYLTSFTSTTTVQGKVGQALSFNGTNNYVNIPTSGSLTITASTTLSIWAKGTVQGSEQELLGNWRGSAYSNLAIFWDDTIDGVTGPDCLAGNKFVGPGNRNAQDGKWHLFTCTWDQMNLRMYIDGVLVNTTAAAVVISNSNADWVIGCAPNNGWCFKGTTDDARVYNRALSASEVSRLYQLGK